MNVSAALGTSVMQEPTVEDVPAVRRPVVFLLIVFLGFWLAGLEQYLFVPFAAVYLLARSHWPRLVSPPAWMWVPLMLVGVLALFASTWSDRPGDCFRTADVWLSGLMLSWVVTSVGLYARRILAATLLGVWLASLAIYVVSWRAPGIAADLLALKHPGSLATGVSFSTPTVIFNLNVARPIGFALYANELACFGLAALAAYLHVRGSRRRWTMVILEIIALVGLVMSTSRSLVLTFAAILVAVVVLRPAAASKDRDFLLPLCIAGLVILGALLAILRPDLFTSGLGGVESLSSARYGGTQQLRSLSYSLGWQLFEQNKWAGIGGLPWLGAVQIGSLSLPISLAVRHGIPGLVAGMFMVVIAMIRALPSLAAASWSSALIAAVVVMYAASCATVQFDDDTLSFAGFVVCVGLLMADRSKPPRTGRNP